MTSYDDWKTDPEYGLSHRDLREAELKAELQEHADNAPISVTLTRRELEYLILHIGRAIIDRPNSTLESALDRMVSALEEQAS